MGEGTKKGRKNNERQRKKVSLPLLTEKLTSDRGKRETNYTTQRNVSAHTDSSFPCSLFDASFTSSGTDGWSNEGQTAASAATHPHSTAEVRQLAIPPLPPPLPLPLQLSLVVPASSQSVSPCRVRAPSAPPAHRMKRPRSYTLSRSLHSHELSIAPSRVPLLTAQWALPIRTAQ